MRVFLSGATGAIGRRLVPKLVAAGHHVFGMTRSERKLDGLRAQGAEGFVCDVFDGERLHALLRDVRPHAVIAQLTNLPQEPNPFRLERFYRDNDRVRRDGTANLVAAAQAAGVRRFLCQSMAIWYAPGGDTPKTEADPLYLRAPEPVGAAVRTLQHMEATVLTAALEGIVLRYGAFYGPGTWHGAGGAIWEATRKRRYPIVGAGSGVYSWIHVDDAADATVAALEGGGRGIYNVVDDEPAPVSAWLPAYAQAIGAPPPRRVPAWLLKPFARGFLAWERSIPGASNGHIAQDLGWRPRWSTWRDGFVHGLGHAAAPDAPAPHAQRVVDRDGAA